LLVALSIVAMRSASERVHVVVLVFAATLMVAFTLLFQYRLS
jgi:hypothetical protein